MLRAASPALPVFLITHEFYPKRGGIATFTEEIAKAAASLGHEVEVWAQEAPGITEKPWPFRLRRVPVKGTHDLSCQLRLGVHLIAARRKLRYATVYLPEPGPMLAMMLLQHLHAFRPKRMVLTFHGSEILRFHRNPAIRPLARRLIRHAWRISVLTAYTEQLLRTHFPEAAGKILRTPGALRSDFSVVRSMKPETRARLVILTVARIHPRKGQLITLQALQRLEPAFRNQIEYWIAGTGNRPRYETELRSAAAAADFPVKFLGDLADEELGEVYEQADIFAMTSVDWQHSVEGFGLVYLEAAAHGLPVIAHAIGGVAEAVQDGVTGLLVPPSEPEKLTGAFRQLLSNPARRHELGEAGRRWARRQSWSESAQGLFA